MSTETVNTAATAEGVEVEAVIFAHAVGLQHMRFLYDFPGIVPLQVRDGPSGENNS